MYWAWERCAVVWCWAWQRSEGQRSEGQRSEGQRSEGQRSNASTASLHSAVPGSLHDSPLRCMMVLRVS